MDIMVPAVTQNHLHISVVDMLIHGHFIRIEMYEFRIIILSFLSLRFLSEGNIFPKFRQDADRILILYRKIAAEMGYMIYNHSVKFSQI